MRRSWHLLAIAGLGGCGGQNAPAETARVDAGSDAAIDAGRTRHVVESLVRGPCTEYGKCEPGESCVSLDFIDRAYSSPVCVATSNPCVAIVCEEGARCSTGDEVPYPMFCR